MSKFLVLSAFAALAPIPSVAQSGEQDRGQELLESLRSLISEDDTRSFVQSKALKALVIEQRKYLSKLEKASRESKSWEVRLGAAFALKELGFNWRLEPITEDAHPLVRSFARAVLVNKPKAPYDDYSAPEPYELDTSFAKQATELATSRVTWSGVEKVTRLEAVFGDLLLEHRSILEFPDDNTSYRNAALRLTRDEPFEYLTMLLEHYDSDPSHARETLFAIKDVFFRAWGKELAYEAYKRSSDVLLKASRHVDPRVRIAGLSTATWLAPLTTRVDVCFRALEDGDEAVRRYAFWIVLNAIHDCEKAALPERADHIVEKLKGHMKGDETTRHFEGQLLGVVDDIKRTRRKIYKGEWPFRYLQAGGAVTQVSNWEWDEAMRRVGRPYVSEAEFRAIRSAYHEYRQQKNR